MLGHKLLCTCSLVYLENILLCYIAGPVPFSKLYRPTANMLIGQLWGLSSRFITSHMEKSNIRDCQMPHFSASDVYIC